MSAIENMASQLQVLTQALGASPRKAATLRTMCVVLVLYIAMDTITGAGPTAFGEYHTVLVSRGQTDKLNSQLGHSAIYFRHSINRKRINTIGFIYHRLTVVLKKMLAPKYAHVLYCPIN